MCLGKSTTYSADYATQHPSHPLMLPSLPVIWVNKSNSCSLTQTISHRTLWEIIEPFLPFLSSSYSLPLLSKYSNNCRTPALVPGMLWQRVLYKHPAMTAGIRNIHTAVVYQRHCVRMPSMNHEYFHNLICYRYDSPFTRHSPVAFVHISCVYTADTPQRLFLENSV